MSTPAKAKVSKILHIIHPADTKTAMVIDEVTAVKSNISFVYRLGEHILSNHRFNEFDIVAVHSCYSKRQKDYLQRLKDIQDRLHEVAGSQHKTLLIYGNAIPLIGDKVFIVPHEGNVILNDEISMGGVDMDTEGLGLTSLAIDYDFSPTNASKRYADCLKYISHKKKVYLLSPQATLDSNGTVRFGTLYIADQGRITIAKECPEIVDKDDLREVSKREIKPITPVYDDDMSTEEQQIEEEKIAEDTDSKVDIEGI